MITAAVFLDRDNTIIHNDGDLGDPDQVKLIKGAASAIASLRGLGFKIVVVSNQGGVARGKYKEADVEAVHERISELIKATTGSTITVDKYYYCPYHPEGKVKKYRQEHPWRKPQPGMLLQAQKDLKLDLARSWMIGDQLRDVQAAEAAGVRAILLTDQAAGPAAGQKPDEGGSLTGDRSYFVAPTLIEAVKIIAQQGRSESAPHEPVVTVPIKKLKRRKASPAQKSTRQAEKKSDNHATPVVEKEIISTAVKTAPLAPRPFRPWQDQPTDEDRSLQPSSTEGPEPQHESPAQPVPEISEPLQPTESAIFAKRLPLEATQQQASDAEPSSPIVLSDRVDQTLRQILQELRNHRAADTDFSFHIVVAIVLQMVAAVCLLAGLWLGGSSLDQFVRWIGVGLIVQLATIAMLLFRR